MFGNGLFTFKFSPKNLHVGDELRTETEIRLSPQNLGGEKDTITEMEVAGQKIYRLNWKQGKTRNSKYPFELDCTIYRTPLVKMIVSNIAKKRPLLMKLFPRDSLRVKLLKRVISMWFRIPDFMVKQINTAIFTEYNVCRLFYVFFQNC